MISTRYDSLACLSRACVVPHGLFATRERAQPHIARNPGTRCGDFACDVEQARLSSLRSEVADLEASCDRVVSDCGAAVARRDAAAAALAAAEADVNQLRARASAVAADASAAQAALTEAETNLERIHRFGDGACPACQMVAVPWLF